MAAAMEQYLGTGRRKCSVARVYLRPGRGRIVINGKASDIYFAKHPTIEDTFRAPLRETHTISKYDVIVNVFGGGVRGQADAIRHGISRALLEVEPELRGALKRAGFLTRDARKKERKKYGQRAARARYQYSKR